MLNRRNFLKTSSLLALAPTVPGFLARTARAAEPKRDDRVLVVVQMDGGNDALNTVIPLSDSNYAKLRPKLKIAEKDAVKLADGVGLHPQLRALDKLRESGQLAVIGGVGYPNPNRSHFRSMAIWHTARFDPEEHSSYGWIGRALDQRTEQSMLVGNDGVPVALRGRRSSAVALGRMEDLSLIDPATAKLGATNAATKDELLDFVRRQAVDAYAASEKLTSLPRGGDDANYPSSGLAERLRLVSRLMKSGLGARVFYTLQGGFDTHSAQYFSHLQLMNEFAGAVSAFFADLTAAKLADRVTLLAFSEFGRTIKENASGGTDHGTAGAVFLAGPSVNGGLHGKLPNLADLEQGEPKMTTDFRRIYAGVLEDWLKLTPRDALGVEMEKLKLFKS
jgi:uncharacterized protein (DUF1501 family)